MELRDRIGINLRKLRRLRNLSQEALALSAGIDRGYVGSLERSEYSASSDTLEKLAKALDIDPSEFMRPITEADRNKPKLLT